jgi:glycosyltransferase involved in cell wall biosynthesis
MFNEEDNIIRSVSCARQVLEEITGDYEILIVNDGSIDRTGGLAEELARKDEKIRVICHPKNMGLGRAVTTGFKNGRCEYILYMDGDNPFEVSEVKKALPHLEEYDVIIGYRIDRRDTLRRYVYSKVYNWLICTLFGLKVRDVNFSFKICRKDIFQNIELKSKGSFIDAELLIKARNNNLRIKEIPIEYTPRKGGTSTLSRPSVIIKILFEMVKLWPELR